MKISRTLMVAVAQMRGSALSASAQELSFIMCGDARPAEQAVIDKFQGAKDGRGRAEGPGDTRRRHFANDRQAGVEIRAIVGRPAPTGRHRPSHRAQPASPPSSANPT